MRREEVISEACNDGPATVVLNRIQWSLIKISGPLMDVMTGTNDHMSGEMNSVTESHGQKGRLMKEVDRSRCCRGKCYRNMILLFPSLPPPT